MKRLQPSSMVSYRSVRIDGVFQLSVAGTLDLDASQALLREIAADATLRGHGLMIDLRTARGDLSYRDVHELIGVLLEQPTAFSNRMALREDCTERFVKAQFSQVYAVERGFAIRAFVDEAAAIAWLEAGEDGA